MVGALLLALVGRRPCYFAVDATTKLFVYAEMLTGAPRVAPAADVTASQLWPASRAAASFLADYVVRAPSPLTVCELGCGLGAPILAASFAGARAIATDVDKSSLEYVTRAAEAQDLCVETRYFDLCDFRRNLPDADLFVLADVVGDRRLAVAVAERVVEATQNDATVLVALEASRPQRLDLVRRLRESLGASVPDFRAAREWRDAPHRLVLLDVDEADPSLYAV